MAEKKKISCRVCGKLFEPCSYCQSHADVFRWRNFACSLKCASKYINDTISYRNSQKNIHSETIGNSLNEEKLTTKKKTSRKTSKEIDKNIITE